MANTLKFGNGQWATGNGTALAYNDENSNFKPLPFDFTRASSGTTVNQSGLIETVGSGIPRIDFQGNTKGALLLEPSRSNVLLQSNQFDTTWLKNNVTILGGQSGIYGSSDAWLLQRGDGLARFLYQNVSISSSSTLSVYAKKGNSNWLFLSDGTGKNKYFDLENGVIGNVGTASNSRIELIGNGWYRCSITVSNGESRIYPAVGDGSVSGLVGANIYIQHAQLEVGSYPTSIIPTSGSAVTRAAESCSQTPPDGVIGQTEGTIFANVGTIVSGSLGADFCSIDDGTGSNRIHMFYNTSSKFGLYSEAGGSTQWLFTSTNTSTGNDKLAIAYKSNDAVFYINGVQVGSTSSFVVPSTSNYRIADRFDEAVKAQVFQSKQAKLYNTRLSNSELAALTQV